MISAKQIRAARAMMNESREDFAKTAGVHKNTLANVEAGKYSSCNIKIMHNLKKIGFEFDGTSGVSLREPKCHVLYSDDSSDIFFQDVLNTIQQSGGTIIVSTDTIEKLLRAFGIDSPDKMNRLEKLLKFVNIKCNVYDALNCHVSVKSIEMRAVSTALAPHFTTIVYGNKFAVAMQANSKKFHYSVTESAEMSQNEIKYFFEIWNKGIPFSQQ